LPSYVEEYAARLEAAGLLASGRRAGCSPEEIEEVRRAQGVPRLPARYRDFLAVLGREPRLMPGSDWTYRDLLTLRADAEELVTGDGIDTGFLTGAVVLQMHQGYQFFFIPADEMEEEDPPVWTYSEGEDGPRPAFQSFSALLDYAARELSVVREVNEELRANPNVSLETYE
jgi:hypothetical protein